MLLTVESKHTHTNTYNYNFFLVEYNMFNVEQINQTGFKISFFFQIKKRLNHFLVIYFKIT